MKSILLLFALAIASNAAPVVCRQTNVTTLPDGSICTIVKELTFTKSTRFALGASPLFVKSSDRIVLSETRDPSMIVKPVIKRKRVRVPSPPPAPPGFKIASGPAYTPTTELPTDRRPMTILKLYDEDGGVFYFFTARQKPNETLQFFYGDQWNDVSYLLAEWGPYPAEQDVGVGTYESAFPKRLFVTAKAVTP